MAFVLRSPLTTTSELYPRTLLGLVVLALSGACSEDDTRKAPASGGSAGKTDGGSGTTGSGGGGSGGGGSGGGGSGGGGSGGAAGATGSGGSAGTSGVSGTGGAAGGAGSDAGAGTPFTTAYGLTGDSYSRGVVVDGAGNIFWVGFFSGEINFGGGVLTSAGDFDAFVVKLDSTGKHVWSKRYGDAQLQWAGVVAVDASGDAYIGGQFAGTIDFGNGGTHTTASNQAYVAKLDGQNGDRIWSFGSSGSATNNLAIEVAVDAQGNLLAVGRSDGSIDLGGGVLARNGAWLAKYGPTGNHLFSDAYGQGSSATAAGMAIDKDGNVLVTGALWTTVNFGGQDLSAVGNIDTFLAKLSPTLTHVWSKSYGAAGLSRGGELATDAQGNVFVTGGLQGSVDFGGGAVTSPAHGHYLAKLDPSGNEIWSKAIAPSIGSTEDLFYEIAVERASGDVVMVGSIEGDVDVGGGVRVGGGAADVFVVEYTSAGAHAFSALHGDAFNQYAVDVIIDGSGNAVVVGHLRGTLDFGSGPISSPNNDHVFIARIALP